MPEQQRWAVEYYTDTRGRAPALEFVYSLSDDEQAELLRVVDLLQEFGIYLRMPHARPIGKLWELRAGAGRLFYIAHTGRRFIILHGYRKQGQKAPRREIETAERRWADFLEREITP
ncbi:MAG TPA: type II toxin-antitoxin system RelE/ParE family toxin [Anaerolineae bacterium]|nr:type II toxin-antitoxin system RelE/ParE family toxin [Anaerolineae bacterium]HPL28306.1 type II toxin-antitoxin system RelE/ParE family toxin [Anaerolineae bacterium]